MFKVIGDINLLKTRLDVETPGRCAPHQCVKQVADPDDKSRSCVFCAHYHLSLKAQTCLDCLSTLHLDHFKPEKYVAESEWYRYLAEHKGFPGSRPYGEEHDQNEI